jgi:uncharacterized protein YkwD
VLLALAACAPADAPRRNTLPAGDYAAQEWGLVGAVNDHRASLRLPLLRWDAGLAAVARRHSRDMAAGRVPFSHQGFERRVAEARHLGYMNVAENLGTNNFDPDTTVAVAMNGFLNSPPHRHSLEGPYDRTGVGVARDTAGYFFYTQLFAR